MKVGGQLRRSAENLEPFFAMVYVHPPFFVACCTMVEFRLAKEFGSKEYMVEVWDGGRIVALIHPSQDGITVSSRNELRMIANQSSSEVYIRFELPI